MSIINYKTTRNLTSDRRPTFKSLVRQTINQPRQRDLIMLFSLSLIFRLVMAAWAPQPWYPDAAYYFDVAKNLATGHGFTEDFIFIYLTPAKSVVHPSNYYWMPLTSIIIAPFLSLFGVSWHIAQIPMILLATFLPLFTYWIGWDIFQSRRYALTMGLFMLIGGYSYPFYLAATDSIALYSWLSLLAFVGMYQGWRGHPWRFALAGIAIGLAHLTRVEGILLLFVGFIIWLCSQKTKDYRGNPLWKSSKTIQLRPIPWQALLGMVGFYLLTMAPWFLRNIALVGSPLPTGGAATIWLTNYADFFSFHKDISLQTYLSWGWTNILSSKVETLIAHFYMLNTLIYVPFAIVFLGIWMEPNRAETLPPLIYLIIMYSTLALIFTIPSPHGTFFHSTLPMIPFLYAWGLTGIDTILAYLSKQSGKRHRHEQKIIGIFSLLYTKIVAIFSNKSIFKQNTGIYFHSHKFPLKDGGAICLAIVMGIVVIAVGTMALTTTATDSEVILYKQVGKIVANDYKVHGTLHDSVQPIVMVTDSADYYYETGQHAILLPTQPLPIVLEAAQSYSASYILFTPEARQIWQEAITDSRLKLVWSSPSGKLYRFFSSSKASETK